MGSISNNELSRRWQAVHNLMTERRLDFLLIQNTSAIFGGHIKWFTDISGQDGDIITVIFPKAEEMTVISHGPSAEYIPSGTFGIRKRIGIPTFPSLAGAHLIAERVVKELSPYKNCRIGLVGMDFISATFYKYVTEQLNTVQFENVTDAIDTIKAIKSDEEIKLIRDTCHLQDVIFEYVLSRVRPGRKAAEIQAEIVIKSMELGGDKTNIKVDVISGTGNSSAHPVISNGDQVSFLIETNGPSGFWAEIGRNICISKISPELQEQFGLAQQVQKITLDILKPGAQPDEMWNANNTFLRKQGYPEERRIYAHSQGYDMVERPSLDLFESIKIHAGMNIVVHPEVVSSKARGWVCENYIVKETGKAECLHQTPQKIFVV